MTTAIVTRWLPALAVAFSLAACGGSSGNPAVTTADTGTPAADGAACTNDCGTVLIGLTDADGDFLQYSVAVTSLSLTRADGTQVEALAQSAVVDFAQYTELTEFLTAATVPNGSYVSAEITLDYADAEATVELDGEPADTQLTDADGMPLTVETLELRLADRHRLVVRPGVPAVMIVDFDLAASHEVDLTTSPVTAVAAPFLVADIDPVESKPMRLRGPLVSVDPDDSSYVVAVRPFWSWQGEFGQARVHTDDDTAFEIDGVSYSAGEGLATMATLPAGTATIAFGVLDVPSRDFMAYEVYAGSSVPGSSVDFATGVIAARTGDVLQVRGVTIIRDQRVPAFRGSVEVIVGPETVVHKAGDPGYDGDSHALSVGQRITVFGRIVNEIPEELTLDATDGGVRMLRTVVAGTTTDISDGQINLDLQHIAGRNIRVYDFSGTGMPGQDADPDNYEVATGQLDMSGLVIGSAVRALGFVSGFGLAPPDFHASTVADFSATRSKLFMVWNPPADTPFLTIGPEGLAIDLDNPDIGRRHHLVRGGLVTDLLTLTSAVILPDEDRPGLYGIRDRRSIRLYTDFELYTLELADQLSAGQTVRSIYANGAWSDSEGEIRASRILLRLN